MQFVLLFLNIGHDFMFVPLWHIWFHSNIHNPDYLNAISALFLNIGYNFMYVPLWHIWFQISYNKDHSDEFCIQFDFLHVHL